MVKWHLYIESGPGTYLMDFSMFLLIGEYQLTSYEKNDQKSRCALFQLETPSLGNAMCCRLVSTQSYDDVIKWKHFPRNWHLCGEFTGPVNSPHKDQWRRALMLSLICVWINDWVNNREAGDLRRYRANYNVIVMQTGKVILGNKLSPATYPGNYRRALCYNVVHAIN